MASLSQPDLGGDAAAVAISATIESFIESAAAAFETDRDASRRFLLQACALLRAKRAAHDPREGPFEQAPTRGGLAPWQVDRVIAHVDAHMASTIQAKDLAALINMSKGQFFRAFKVSVGMPPLQYIARRRIERARELMKTTSEPLCQIAIACGLYDQSHFCRVFRRLVGQSPRAWRQANARGPSPLRSVGQGPLALRASEFTHSNSHLHIVRRPERGEPRAAAFGGERLARSSV
jgi:AraC family transcriptional regulator